MPTALSPAPRASAPQPVPSAALPPALLLPLADACARGCALTGALAAEATGAVPPAPPAAHTVARARDAAARLGRAAAHAGLTPDALLLLLDDEVHARLAAGAVGSPGRGGAPDRTAADAVVVFLWGGARNTYHATRAALDARARRRAGRPTPAAPRARDAA